MADTTFTDAVTLTAADWFNDVNRLHYTIFGDPADDAAARTGLGLGTAAVADLIDEDSMATDSATKVPSQQSVKAYVDAQAAAGITLATPQATTSGTEFNFTAIPAGTKRITVNFASISTNAASILLIQIGDSGGIENTGYVGAVGNTGGGLNTSSAGFPVVTALVAAQAHYGSVILTLENSSANTWSAIGNCYITGTTMCMCSGHKSLSGVLDRVRITTSGGDTFDAGEVNICYE